MTAALLALLLACQPRGPAEPVEPPPLPGFMEPTPVMIATPPPPGAQPPFQAMTMRSQDVDSSTLIIGLHGHGGWPGRMRRVALPWTRYAHVVLPAAPKPWRLGWTWFDASPRRDSPELAAEVANMADRLADWLRQMKADPLVVTGFSQGAILSYALAVRHPDLISAAVPTAGYLPADLMPETLPENPPPIIALHGLDDDIVPAELGIRSIDELAAMGWPAEMYTWEGVPHVIPDNKVSVVDLKIRAVATGRPVLRSARPEADGQALAQ